MLKQPPSRLLEALRRLGRSPAGPEGSDAVLLGRFVELRDESAFETIMRRHGDMVMRTCRRHLGSGPNAEDAFQAVFLALARDAARIGRRESLAGWLFRVAYFVSRKLMGRNARRRAQPIRDEDCPSSAAKDSPDSDELRAEVEREVNLLLDRLRAPVVLCYLEGHSNSEAAALLGVPKGTIDSRLSSARSKLRAALTRRGIALGAGATVFETLWYGEGNAAVPGLLRRTLEAAMSLVKTGTAAGAVSREVLSLVAGVSPAMSNYRLSFVLIAALLIVTAGGTGLSVFNAQADGAKSSPPKKAEAANEKPQQVEPTKIAELKTVKTNEAVHELLDRPLDMDTEPPPMPLKEMLAMLQVKFGVPIRIDLAAFSRINKPEAANLYEQQVQLSLVRGMNLGDALNDILAQLSHSEAVQPGLLAFRVRRGQIAIVPAFKPSIRSVGERGNDDEGGAVPPNELIEQDEGEPISLSVEEKPFSDVLRQLRETTGANIVLDVRQADKAKQVVSATLHDVRLMAALRVLGDMCELQPVALNNVFYVTSKENAEKLQREIDLRRHGEQSQAPLGGIAPGTTPGAGAPALPAPAPSPATPAKPNAARPGGK
jgi:RNA polymerase sigma factor (sigma-70 family)